MNRGELVSVIIPVYNVRPYIIYTLDSVCHQTYTNLEIILVDDGSTDGSGEICDEYALKDPRVCVIHQENKGVSAARNVGLDRMHGIFTAFLDSDDAYDESFIEKLLLMMQEGIDITVCKFAIHNTEGKLDSKINAKGIPSVEAGVYDRTYALRELANGNINVGVFNKLYRRNLWTDIRFPEGHVFEDFDITYQIINKCGSICVMDDPLYQYRKHPGSITETISIDNLNDRYLAYSHFMSFVENNIPEIYQPEHLTKIRRMILGTRIRTYLCASKNGYSDTSSFCKELRKQIFIGGKETGISSLGVKTGIAWCMMAVCPSVLKLLYRIYHPIRFHLWKRFGK